jgi:hypothetical protein
MLTILEGHRVVKNENNEALREAVLDAWKSK